MLRFHGFIVAGTFSRFCKQTGIETGEVPLRHGFIISVTYSALDTSPLPHRCDKTRRRVFREVVALGYIIERLLGRRQKSTQQSFYLGDFIDFDRFDPVPIT